MKWSVNVFSTEISVDREDNPFGKTSYGWADKKKIIIYSGRSREMQEIAKKVAKALSN